MNKSNPWSSRVMILSILLFFVIVLYILKLFSMQIVHGDIYRKQSQNISKRSTKIPSQRGEIFDTAGALR